MNEAANIVQCVSALLSQTGRLAAGIGFTIRVLANNCTDNTVPLLRRYFGSEPTVKISEMSWSFVRADAGRARRIAMDLAAADLEATDDLLLSTDADTVVAADWCEATLRYFEKGFDAVAGIARVRPNGWDPMAPEQRKRLTELAKYKTLISYLRRERANSDDPWPNHEYEGGASMALTLGMYRRIGGCPPCPTGEDRALFEAVRIAGGRIRHALDVKVYTSGRQFGRAQGGTADTIRIWCGQSERSPIHETWRLNAELGHAAKTPDTLLCFDELPDEIARAKELVRVSRKKEALAFSA
jgi:cellulose synthase/poly-beta-1,6-N-acetylglucosamine synthase-like glycosyltransferase